MEDVGVLITSPMYSYLEGELASRFKLFRLWNFPQMDEFLKENSGLIRAIVGNPNFTTNREVIDSLPALEIVSSFSVGLDSIDLAYCKEKGVRVTNTPDVLTEDVADTAIGLILATLRGICECDRYVRGGLWKKGDFKLTTKVFADLWLPMNHIHRPSVLLGFPEDKKFLCSVPNLYTCSPLSHKSWDLGVGSSSGPHFIGFKSHRTISARAIPLTYLSYASGPQLLASKLLSSIMEAIGVLMTYPMSSYLEQELDKRFNLFRMWNLPQKNDFFKEHSASIRAVVGNANVGADRELIDTLPALEIVSNFSVGLDKVDLGHCKEKGIRVTNTPDVLTEDVADLAIGLMLATLRGICECDRYVRAGLWKKGDFKLTTKFSGKKVGIIGLGRIGTAIAKRAEAFNCPISYYSRSQKPESKYKYFPSVVELASDCDILVVACALTAETRHIINRQVIDALGPKGFLINIGRGPHIDEPELVSALVERRIAGAGLDVFENEPHVPEELFGLDNVVLLPHVASGTVETRNAMADLVVGNLEAHFSKKPLLTPVV
ncbi:hypothetical protein L2E82_02540 [Cichorium intybus]|uniref:Uncharacterized protein n=1 Tax=Cichorium intybus TaxID=13427 RepID=A0ACB9H2G4_CICIN|nr:hypothetical protein L2E82_02540 [Cichorium intybus]